MNAPKGKAPAPTKTQGAHGEQLSFLPPPPFCPTWPKRGFEARLNNMLSRRDHLDNFVKSLEANPKQFPDFGPRLGEIAAPTLIVWGRNDRFVPMDAGLRLLAGIAGSELHIYRDCGHWAQWEHADSFNQLVLNFLARA